MSWPPALVAQAATGRLDAVLAGLFLWLEAFLIWPMLFDGPQGVAIQAGLLLAGHALVGDASWGDRLKPWTAWVFCAVWVGSFLSWSAPTGATEHTVFAATATGWFFCCLRRGPS